jgi:hypothetical protein
VILPAFPGRSLLAFVGRPRVVMSSPHSPADCGLRLETVTGRLPWNVAGFERRGRLPLQGRVSPGVIRVARTRRANRRSNLDALFIGRIEQAQDGGTLVVGTVGPDPSIRILFVVFPVVVLLIGGGFIAEGLWSVWSGHRHLSYLLQAWFPIVLAGAFVRTLVTGPAKVQREVQALLDELNTILDSTVSFSDDRASMG